MRWIEDRNELLAVLSEVRETLNNRRFQNTADLAAAEEHERFVDHVGSPAEPLFAELDRQFLTSPLLAQLPHDRYGQYIRVLRNEIELFREENVALGAEETKVSQQYNAIIGGLTVPFEGGEYVMPQMSQFLHDDDRSRRQAAWEAMSNVLLSIEEDIHPVLDRLIELRGQMARNAGFPNYRDFRHRELGRVDYSPADCFQFHDSVQTYFLPLYKRILEKRREQMRLDVLKPWDLAVDPKGRPPLRPCPTVDSLIDAVIEIRSRIAPQLGEMTRHQRDNGLLDLETRQNKAQVGYNVPLLERGFPFVFMNVTGLHSDLIVLLHESGHATHTYSTRTERIVRYRLNPSEVSELASMSMELISMRHWDVVYSHPEDLQRAIADQLEGIISGLPHTMMIDAFQHWLYTQPDHSHQERNRAWAAIHDRFSTGMIDRTGWEHLTEIGWQRVFHLFLAPMYYIEYGIAQFGALQIYRNYLRDPADAVEKYLRALQLGSSRPIPEIYAAAGIKFDFSDQTARELSEFCAEQLEKYDA